MTTATGVRQRPPLDQLDDTGVRALTEALTVLPDYGRARGADDCYVVVSHSGSEYFVDGRAGACECPDAIHRGSERSCKHAKRVAYATGDKVIPGWVDPAEIHHGLGRHVAGTPRIMTPDGPRPLAEVRDR